ncbi:MMPL family transporter [Streptomyces sp. NPDC002490]|uniref:MMPL family transporter n=1 Tax=Streptomyces sp. NPDC002490 TaxID=3154416 RepID=UPI00332A2DAB
MPKPTRPAGSSRAARLLIPLVLLVTWLEVGGVLGPYAGRLGEVATNDQAAFLPRSAESTRVIDVQEDFRQGESLPLVVVWTARGDGAPLPEAARGGATRVLTGLAGATPLAGAASPALASDDGRALRAVVPLRTDLDDGLADALDEIGAQARTVPGTVVHLAGPAAAQADLKNAFSGIDGLLLGVALATVLVILLLVYRSLLLPLLIIVAAVLALALACAVVYALAERGVVRVDGQVQGILSILVIGAATDYALLLTARFREELTRGDDRTAAMRAALRRSAGPVLASAATVALGLLALLLSDLTNNRALGPVGAVGIVCAVAAALTFLPAVLVLLGRAAYWPARPSRTDGEARGGSHRLWRRVADLVDRAPRRVWALTLAALLACAAFAPTLTSRGVPLDETLVGEAPSVTAQAVLGEHFPGGSGSPAVVVARADALEPVTAAARQVPGVASVLPTTAGDPGGPPLVADGRVRLDVTLADPADGEAAERTVTALREAVHAVPDAEALVGGVTAQRIDTQRTAAADRALIVPVVLALILVILTALLRSLLMPLLLVATVALNFFATLGVASLVFTHLWDFTGTDASVPLYGFVFLVALGVDYNIFLMSRVREESIRLGTREGLHRGLVATGGVITSAGVVLAATFAALGVIPLAFLIQIAFIVAFGVLLDTLVVRSLLVPALVRQLGPRAWWPGGPAGFRSPAA